MSILQKDETDRILGDDDGHAGLRRDPHRLQPRLGLQVPRQGPDFRHLQRRGTTRLTSTPPTASHASHAPPPLYPQLCKGPCDNPCRGTGQVVTTLRPFVCTPGSTDPRCPQPTTTFRYDACKSNLRFQHRSGPLNQGNRHIFMQLLIHVVLAKE